MKLSAPETGPYAGIVIYHARDNSSKLTLLGATGSSVTGFIYAPAAHIDYAGSNAECIRLVGKTLQMRGNSDLGTNCEDELGGKKMYAAGGLRLAK